MVLAAMMLSSAAVDDGLSGYDWLRGDPESTPLSSWLTERAAERAAFRARPEIVSHRERAVAALASATSVSLQGAPFVAGGGILSLDRLPGAVQRSVSRRTAGVPSAQTIVPPDENAIDWFFPSSSGRLLAVGASAGGSERSAGFVMDLTTGRRLPDRLEGVRHACVSWLPDETAFAYSRYPDDRDYGRELWLHRLGDDQSADVPLWRQDAQTTHWPDIEVAPDGVRALVHVSIGWTDTDVHLLDLGTGSAVPVVQGRRGMTRLHFTESGAIIGVTGVDAPNGRLVSVDAARPEPEHWTDLLAESDIVLDDCSVRDAGVFVVGEREMSSVVGHLPLTVGADGPTADEMPTWAQLGTGHVAIAFPTPGQSTMRNRVVRHLDQATAVFTWSSMADPARQIIWSPGSDPQPWDGADAACEGLPVRGTSVAASDGESIPLLVLEPEGTADAPLPTLLHGYGGFGLSSTAAYSELATAWVALGGRYVVAGLRGGRERGGRWHEAGRLQHRQRVFDDFADVADALVAGGLCSREELAIWGSSNGGLLIAAIIVQRPDLCAAAHAAVPMTDMLGYHRLSIARLWMSDFGDPENADERSWIRAYSPLHTVRAGSIDLPDIIVTTGRNDTRVAPFHAYAFVEALRERRTADAGAALLLAEDLHGGHGIGKPADAFVDERADVFALFLAAFARRATGETGASGRDSETL